MAIQLPVGAKYIAGIDASTNNIGWAVLDYESERLVKHGRVHFNPEKIEYYQRLKQGPGMLFQEMEVYRMDALVIEHSFFTKNAMVGKAITMVIGAILYEALNRGVPIVLEMAPTEIKKGFAMTGFADKKNIRNQVFFEFQVNPSEDECDAIAVAASFIRLYKTGHFERKEFVAREKKYNAALKREQKEAEKTGKALPGELKFGKTKKGELGF